jgi:hypothetical protein
VSAHLRRHQQGTWPILKEDFEEQRRIVRPVFIHGVTDALDVVRKLFLNPGDNAVQLFFVVIDGR